MGSSGPCRGFSSPKEKLAVFWKADVERPARDLLDKDEG